MGKKKVSNSKLNFEKSLKELEAIAAKLEEGDLGLEESIKAFEKGIEYAKFCHEKLEEAERKIMLLQKGTHGEVKARKVKLKNNTGEIDEESDLQGTLL